MELRWSDGLDPDFQTLTCALDAYFYSILGDQQAQFDRYNQAAALADVALFYDSGKAVACGALKRHDGGIAEVKRVYVSPEYRNRGLAAQLLEALEERAGNIGCERLLVETNPQFSDAVRLYRRHGFTPAEPYGPYQGMNTLCLTKALPNRSVSENP